MPGIYVETLVRTDLAALIAATQQPELHGRWDLRFSEIRYLPRDPGSDQRFLYATRIGFGLRVRGVGESTGDVRSAEGAVSGLRFWSDAPASLIARGSGYWRYVRTADGIRFLTFYDYETRFGRAGALADRIAFRPLLGWATAWSFDALRLWLERGVPPERGRALAALRAAAATLALAAGARALARPHGRKSALAIALLGAAIALVLPDETIPSARRCRRTPP